MEHDPIEQDQGNTQAVKEMLAGCGYSQKAIGYFTEKAFMGILNDADQTSELIGSCGDTMKVSLKVENGIIMDARYQVLGCPGAVASAMAAATLIKGKPIKDARKLLDSDVYRELEDIPAQKHHCIQLAVKALHKAIDEYNNGHQKAL